MGRGCTPVDRLWLTFRVISGALCKPLELRTGPLPVFCWDAHASFLWRKDPSLHQVLRAPELCPVKRGLGLGFSLRPENAGRLPPKSHQTAHSPSAQVHHHPLCHQVGHLDPVGTRKLLPLHRSNSPSSPCVCPQILSQWLGIGTGAA